MLIATVHAYESEILHAICVANDIAHVLYVAIDKGMRENLGCYVLMSLWSRDSAWHTDDNTV